jgi:hypothetical protein
MTQHHEGFPDLRFLVEPASDGGERRRGARGLAELAVGRGLRVLDLESFASNPQLVTAPPDRALDARTLHFESIAIGSRAALLMLTPPGVRVRINDRPSPMVAVLRVGDQLRLGDTTLHLTQYREFAAGSPSPELLGRRCGVCRVPFDPETRVVVHDCGEAFHLEPESKPAEERLECARLGDCPNCGEPIPMESGYAFWPEL